MYKTMKKICVFCASSNRLEDVYFKAGEELGKWMGEQGMTLVNGGANCGLMEVLAKNVHESGGKVLGIVPKILDEKNRVSSYLDEIIPTEDLTDRKAKLIANSDFLIAMPGGIGTLDEAFTVMSANTIGLEKKRVIFWNVNGFWNSLFAMIEDLQNKNVINNPLSDFLVRADSFEELIKLIQG